MKKKVVVIIVACVAVALCGVALKLGLFPVSAPASYNGSVDLSGGNNSSETQEQATHDAQNNHNKENAGQQGQSGETAQQEEHAGGETTPSGGEGGQNQSEQPESGTEGGQEESPEQTHPEQTNTEQAEGGQSEHGNEEQSEHGNEEQPEHGGDGTPETDGKQEGTDAPEQSEGDNQGQNAEQGEQDAQEEKQGGEQGEQGAQEDNQEEQHSGEQGEQDTQQEEDEQTSVQVVCGKCGNLLTGGGNHKQDCELYCELPEGSLLAQMAAFGGVAEKLVNTVNFENTVIMSATINYLDAASCRDIADYVIYLGGIQSDCNEEQVPQSVIISESTAEYTLDVEVAFICGEGYYTAEVSVRQLPTA